MARKHQILVGPDDKGRDAAVRCADPGLVAVVRNRIELQAKPRTCPADLLSDRGSVLANTGGKHEPVETAKRCSKRADMACDVMAEEVYREARAGLVARQQLAKIGRDPGEAKNSGFAMK